jgi:hypothetical protein
VAIIKFATFLVNVSLAKEKLNGGIIVLNSLKYWGRKKPVEQPVEDVLKTVTADKMIALTEDQYMRIENDLLGTVLREIKGRAKAGYNKLNLDRCRYENKDHKLTEYTVDNVASRLRNRGFVVEVKHGISTFNLIVYWTKGELK